MRHRDAILALVPLLVLTACEGAGDSTTSSGPRSISSAPSSSVTTTSTATTTTSPGGGTDETGMCTSAGCDSVLTIELTEVDITPEATYGIELCVDGDCTAETITIDVPHPGTGEIIRGENERTSGTLAGRMLVWADGDYIDYHLPDEEYGSSASLTFTLTASDGQVLARTDGPTEVPLRRSQPNGHGCLPICFSGRLTV